MLMIGLSFLQDFPSDLFIDMEAAGAKLVVSDADGNRTQHSPVEWLAIDMNRKVLVQIVLPALHEDTAFRSFKITPRSQNAHAYVNGAIRGQVSKSGDTLVGAPSIVFGGIRASFHHAAKTEQFLKDKKLSDKAVVKKAMELLDGEVDPEEGHLHASIAYRKHLTQALLYKFILGVLDAKASDQVRSGAGKVPRGVSRGDQSYVTDPSIYPLSKPIAKVESRWVLQSRIEKSIECYLLLCFSLCIFLLGNFVLLRCRLSSRKQCLISHFSLAPDRPQCTGEAEYSGDVPPVPGELHAALVMAQRANCELSGVDAADALAMPGVVAFLDHNDIPGANQVFLSLVL